MRNVLIGLLMLGGCELVARSNGENKKIAEEEARQFAADLGFTPETIQGVACSSSDSDSDGYVSCAIMIKNKEQPLNAECVAAYSIGHGCRPMKAIMSQ